MKHGRFFRIMAAAVILALLMLAIPITPALGSASVTLTAPTTPSGSPGMTVTLSCTEFTVSETYTVSFGTTTVTSGSTGTTGNFTASFSVPENHRGNYVVTVTTPPDGGVPLSGGFTITPKVVPNVTTANVGDTITVDGSGFKANDTITIYYDTTSVGTKTADNYGTFDDFTLTVPASVEGNHTIKGRDDVGYSPTVYLEIDPEITINPISGDVDDEVTVTGTGFDDDSDITLYFDSDEVDITDGDDETDDDGSFECTFDVPEASRGSYTVRAQDAGGNYDTATFIVSASITIDPESGPSGTTVTVTGTGFRPSHAITVSYDDVDITDDITGDDDTDPEGSFEFTFVVPPGDAGTYEIEVSDGTNAATADFESTTSATISQTTTSTAPGHVGMSLTITGIGFTPDSTVTVTYTTDPVTLTTVTAGPTGNFTATFTIPASEGGEHTITVSDGTITKTFDFYMEENPPPTPELVAPDEGEKADSETIFEWEEVDDVEPESDPVSYDLQVATSDSFSAANLIINETGIEESTHTVLPDDKLESTGEDAPYYWRVRAVDAASNESEWSEEGTFTVGWSFQFTGWVVWVTMVVVAAIFFFFGLWIGRRSGGGEYY